ncbi:MAG: DNA polymerase IV [Syntrophobacterales bacterium]|nr:MAG: DNA polymerase IV [Syntrophobacterales bacterium]
MRNENRVILHVDMDAFFASVEQQRNPKLRGRPVAVCGKPPRTVVVSASYEARSFGIQANMSFFEARRRCPGLRCVEGNLPRYTTASLRVMCILKEYCPHIEMASIDEAFLDMTHSRLGFESHRGTAEAIKKRIFEELGLTCSVGVGPNKLIAKLASSQGKPDGLIVLSATEVPHYLDNLPIGELWGIGPKREEALRSLGIQYCGDLGRVPANLLKKRFGFFGERLRQMGLGIDETPVIPLGQEAYPKSFGHFVTLPEDTDDTRVISGLLLRLSEQVGRRLRRNRLRGRRVTLTVRFSDFSTVSRQKTFADTLNSGKEIYRLALRIWDSIGDKRPVRLLGVRVSNLEGTSTQFPLFSWPKKSAALWEAMDRVNDKYGDFTLTWGSLHVPPR